MTWIKICGITSRDALTAAVDGGADAVGFNLAPQSPRYLEVGAVRELMDATPIVGFIVTVDASPIEVLDLASRTGATGVQAHGRYSALAAEAAAAAGYRVLRPVPVGPDGPTIDIAMIPGGETPLFDTASARLHGGSGATFRWDHIVGLDRDFVVAGGLGVDNVAELIREVRPYGVDASSRLEISPGVKDPDSIRDFIENVKQA